MHWNSAPLHAHKYTWSNAKAHTEHILFISERLITKSLWSWPQVGCKENQLQGMRAEKQSVKKRVCVSLGMHIYARSLGVELCMPLQGKKRRKWHVEEENQTLLIRQYKVVMAFQGRLTPSFIWKNVRAPNKWLILWKRKWMWLFLGHIHCTGCTGSPCESLL